jgi:hypothetical protein
MSFDIYSNKPKLVEKNILKYINNKKKQKYLAKVEAEQKEIVQKEIELEVQSQTWYGTIGKQIWEFIKENYGFVLLISLISLLLFIRYIECNKKKEKIKDIVIKHINKKNKYDVDDDILY